MWERGTLESLATQGSICSVEVNKTAILTSIAYDMINIYRTMNYSDQCNLSFSTICNIGIKVKSSVKFQTPRGHFFPPTNQDDYNSSIR